ncbi:rod shape-determining protein MreC [Christensenellaceae bacterium OttesenSCG-928-M15]|nr:rod shape-determining protein MreC [Christensenellaceae bacterium OttesenSCG-928-M15]
MRHFFKNKPLLIAVIAVVLLLILALISAGDRTATFFESAVGGVLQPVQSFASRASDAIIDFVENVFNTTDADQENRQLKSYISQLEERVSKMETIEEENRRLKDLLAFAEGSADIEYVSGSVIAHSQGIWFDTFTINLGRNNGVEKDMPVTNAQGLVGRITQVGSTYSKVVSIIDSSMSVSVMIERTRDSGMVRGKLEPGSANDILELYYLPADSDLLPGDKVVTSGVGGIYPKGVLVGTVLEVNRPGESDFNATVSPAVDFRRIEEVLVAVNMPAEEEVG